MTLTDLAHDAEDPPGLLAVLAKVTDPRHRRGIRHRLVAILGLAVCAVLAGARSFAAIAEWAADADEQTLARLGVRGAVPSESTFRRTLQRLDADSFNGLAGQWAQQQTAPAPGSRRVIAVDGKTLRGSGHGGRGRWNVPMLAPVGLVAGAAASACRWIDSGRPCRDRGQRRGQAGQHASRTTDQARAADGVHGGLLVVVARAGGCLWPAAGVITSRAWLGSRAGRFPVSGPLWTVTGSGGLVLSATVASGPGGHYT